MMNPSNRRPVLGGCGLLVALLALGAMHGAYAAAHGRYWMTRANGGFRVLHWGLAAVAGSLFLIVYAVATSYWMERLEWALPVHGRWARSFAAGVMVALFLLVLIILILQPIA